MFADWLHGVCWDIRRVISALQLRWDCRICMMLQKISPQKRALYRVIIIKGGHSRALQRAYSASRANPVDPTMTRQSNDAPPPASEWRASVAAMASRTRSVQAAARHQTPPAAMTREQMLERIVREQEASDNMLEFYGQRPRPGQMFESG
ncbi:hypothetical protein LIA77_05037 [Sarocladium implicatum]|nr:hypothetical protein LIA77_05037 [Sarocladium implicatum]